MWIIGKKSNKISMEEGHGKADEMSNSRMAFAQTHRTGSEPLLQRCK